MTAARGSFVHVVGAASVREGICTHGSMTEVATMRSRSTRSPTQRCGERRSRERSRRRGVYCSALAIVSCTPTPGYRKVKFTFETIFTETTLGGRRKEEGRRGEGDSWG